MEMHPSPNPAEAANKYSRSEQTQSQRVPLFQFLLASMMAYVNVFA
jgi:hypothetical protein